MRRGISLSSSATLLFGAASAAILAAALWVPWNRFTVTVAESQREIARQVAETWLANGFSLGSTQDVPMAMRLVEAPSLASDAPWIADAAEEFERDGAARERFSWVTEDGRTTYRYARAVREAEWRRVLDPSRIDFSTAVRSDEALRAVIVIERSSPISDGLVIANRVMVVGVGLGAVAGLVVVSMTIQRRVYGPPLERLRETAERAARSAIETGDSIGRLSAALDAMLGEMQRAQAQLRQLNEGLDLKVVELKEANVGLFESNRLKSEFLANVSHELRTPLNSIIGFAELLDEIARNDPSADPKRRRYITNILQSGRMLLDMINELLDMAKIEAGRMEVTVAPTSIADVVEGLQALMRPQAMARKIEVETQVEDGLPPVETDGGKVRQVLYNFLSNAIKFSPEGSTVRVVAQLVRSGERGQSVRLSVVDRGPGIPPDMQESIFEKFRQVDASHTRRHSGTGLGLSICKELAGLLGATVALHSAPGEGSTFSLEVPVFFKRRELPPLMKV
jgi:signal transduction histidine kinase